jgi:hypothetical protein
METSASFEARSAPSPYPTTARYGGKPQLLGGFGGFDNRVLEGIDGFKFRDAEQNHALEFGHRRCVVDGV